MKRTVWSDVVTVASIVFLTVLVAGSASAQTGDMLRSINEYGKEYRPILPEQLRLLSPANESPPDFAKDSYTTLVATKMVTGEYYLVIEDQFSDLPLDLTEAQGIVIARSRELCGITGSEGETNQQRGCFQYYYDIGKQAYNLRTIKAFNYCKGNIRMMLNSLNEQIDVDNITAIGAGVEFATLATAYKWCTVNFGQNLTVVPPTTENTKFSPPEGWEPVKERTPADDRETIDAATAKEMLQKRPTPLASKNASANATNATAAPVAADSQSGWMRIAIYVGAGLCLVVLIVAAVIYQGRRKPRSPQQHHASSHAGHSVHGK